ncbi:MAG: CapA family protein [Muribaculum sp.]|nr:CapA family protein [Muribaculum sp.]
MKILIAGDYYPVSIDSTKTIVEALHDIKQICSACDYSIINYESPISSEWDSPIAKCGPTLKTKLEAAKALADVGFNCVTLANNHVLDQGDKTLVYTINKFKEIGIDTVGVGTDLQDSKKILYKKIDNQTLAIINCCENEFSIATEDSPGANPLNPVSQYYSIKEAKQNADVVLIIVHGGHEHYQLPSPRMKELYQFFIDCGADAVINHHQHCYSGFEFYKNRPIVYGLGNFLFAGGKGNSDKWYEGYLIQMEARDGNITIEQIPYEQCKNSFSVNLLKDKTYFQSQIENLNEKISNPSLLQQNFNEWALKNEGVYRESCIPYQNRFFRKAANLGWISNGLNREHLLQKLNYIQCEAHRDIFISFLRRLCR